MRAGVPTGVSAGLARCALFRRCCWCRQHLLPRTMLTLHRRQGCSSGVFSWNRLVDAASDSVARVTPHRLNKLRAAFGAGSSCTGDTGTAPCGLRHIPEASTSRCSVCTAMPAATFSTTCVYVYVCGASLCGQSITDMHFQSSGPRALFVIRSVGRSCWLQSGKTLRVVWRGLPQSGPRMINRHQAAVSGPLFCWPSLADSHPFECECRARLCGWEVHFLSWQPQVPRKPPWLHSYGTCT